MYQTMQKAAKDVEECKEMLVNMQGQLDRMEEKQEEMVRKRRLITSVESGEKQEEVMQDGSEGKTDKKSPISSIIKKLGWNSSDDEEDEDEEEDEEEKEEEEEEKKGSGGRRRIPLVAMAHAISDISPMGGGVILIGGALHHHLG